MPKKGKGRPVDCKHCGEAFTAAHHLVLYCSVQCRKRAKYDRATANQTLSLIHI